ncbi:hypothetical protein [Ruegeria sp.]|uniref:hypothetical protein n=1 Tax=Ruegeria sp. TaxID=1879320 RepID=UPI003B5B0595
MEYRFKILDFHNYDGDSFDLTLDLGFDLIAHRKCRLHGVDTPELRGGTDLSKRAGLLARDAAGVFVQQALEAGAAYFLSQKYTGKFGRPLGDIFNEQSGARLVSYLISKNLGVPYEGQNKSEVATAHARNMRELIARGALERGT